jgi:endonuclease/exonuclease/phosphatase family metal-dependent hydrolase
MLSSMRSAKSPFIPLLLFIAIGFIAACSSEKGSPGEDVKQADAPETEDTKTVDIAHPNSGELRVLTYNVAGLPEGLSGSHPEANIPVISPLLNAFDLVLLQEDFWYHGELKADASHPFQSEPWLTPANILDMGDGLNRFSRSTFGKLTRTAWPGCNGDLDCSSDCLATKGFSVARHTLSEGVEVDVYNLHMEAGGCPEDAVIRAQSVDQLLETLAERSKDVPVIMAGDFNLHEEDPVELALVNKLLDEGGLTMACWATECGASRIDRILVKSHGDVTLEPLNWEIPEEFQSPAGAPLSDHDPVAARVRWQLTR